MGDQKRQEDTMTRTRINRPGRYHVVFHNDDFTTTDFVVKVLRRVFFLPESKAVELMLLVHNIGCAAVGCYPLDIARSKAQMATRLARAEDFPLKITIEEAL